MLVVMVVVVDTPIVFAECVCRGTLSMITAGRLAVLRQMCFAADE